MSWEKILKNEDEYTRLHSKLIELGRLREEVIDELHAIREGSPDEHTNRIQAQEEIISLDKEILDVYLEIGEKYKHHDTHERLGDER